MARQLTTPAWICEKIVVSLPYPCSLCSFSFQHLTSGTHLFSSSTSVIFFIPSILLTSASLSPTAIGGAAHTARWGSCPSYSPASSPKDPRYFSSDPYLVAFLRLPSAPPWLPWRLELKLGGRKLSQGSQLGLIFS